MNEIITFILVVFMLYGFIAGGVGLISSIFGADDGYRRDR